MANVKAFRAYITHRDVVDFMLLIEKGRVAGLAVNYRAHIRGEWMEVVRYDTSHGHLHVHRFWRPEGEQVEPLEPPGKPAGAYDAWLRAIEEDIWSNWERYRRSVEATS